MLPIISERLLIREFVTDDSDFIIELLNSPDWIRFIGDRHIKTKADAEQYITNGPIASYNKNGFGLCMVELKDAKTPVGMCGLIQRDFLEHPDIGFAYLPHYFKKGFGFEAASAVLNYGKNVLKLKNVSAITDEDNNRSIQLLEKLGLQYEKKIQLPGEETELLLFNISFSSSEKAQ